MVFGETGWLNLGGVEEKWQLVAQQQCLLMERAELKLQSHF